MNLHQTGQLLALASVIDNRTVTVEAAKGWHHVVGHLDYDLAVAGMYDHFRTSTDYLLPAHVIAGARRVRDRRSPTPELLELEAPVDPHSGLREYIASEGVDWEAFKALRAQGVSLFDAVEQLRSAGGER